MHRVAFEPQWRIPRGWIDFHFDRQLLTVSVGLKSSRNM